MADLYRRQPLEQRIGALRDGDVTHLGEPVGSKPLTVQPPRRPAVDDDWEQDLHYCEVGLVLAKTERKDNYVNLYECCDCGAFVESRKTHDKWHQQLSKETRRG